MTGASTSITLALKGVDNVSGMLSKVTGKVQGLNAAGAKGLGASGSGSGSAGLFGGSGRFLAVAGAVTAIAAAAGLAARQLVRVSNEMSAITDRAQDAGTTSGALMSAVQAMKELGVRGASMETVSRAMQEMVRRTGLQGREGFAAILEEVAAMNSEQERAAALAKAFGRAQGAAFMPIVNGGQAGVRAFLDLAGAQAVASEQAMTSADRFADLWSRTTYSVKQAVFQFTGDILGDFAETFRSMGITGSDMVKSITKWTKYFFDAIRVVVIAIRPAVAAVAGTVQSLAHQLEGIVKVVHRLVNRDFSGAAAAANKMGNDMIRDAVATYEGVRAGVEGWFDLPDDLFRPLAEAGAEEVSKSTRKAARDALRGLSGAGDGSSGSRGGSFGSFAEAMGYGSAAAAKALWKSQNPRLEQQALQEQRRTNELLAQIEGRFEQVEVE